jgi:hypothetical protein
MPIITAVIVLVVPFVAVFIYVDRCRSGRRQQKPHLSRSEQQQPQVTNTVVNQSYETPVASDVAGVTLDYEEPIELSPAYANPHTDRVELDSDNYVSSPSSPSVAASTYSLFLGRGSQPRSSTAEGSYIDLDAKNYISV